MDTIIDLISDWLAQEWLKTHRDQIGWPTGRSVSRTIWRTKPCTSEIAIRRVLKMTIDRAIPVMSSVKFKATNTLSQLYPVYIEK